MPPEEEIRHFVRKMNEAWLGGQIDELERYFAPDVIVAPSGDNHRVTGREAVVDSYRQYSEQAITHRFEELEIQVDHVAETAVVVLRFAIRYEIGGSTYEETGRDILVLAPAEGSWWVVWRTQIIEASKQES